MKTKKNKATTSISKANVYAVLKDSTSLKKTPKDVCHVQYVKQVSVECFLWQQNYRRSWSQTLAAHYQPLFNKLNTVLIVADKGSDVAESCTKETNTKCKCRGSFVTWDHDDSTCKCDPGFGLKDGGR